MDILMSERRYDMADGFSEQIALFYIPEGAGVALIEDATGQVLQILASNNIRRRIGELMDSKGTICVHGPRIYKEQEAGHALFVRWKLTPHYKAEKQRLVDELKPVWAK